MSIELDKHLGISKKRKEIIEKYTEAAIYLYGVITIYDFVEVFNFYEDEKTNVREVSIALTREAFSYDEGVEYVYFEYYIIGPDFLPEEKPDNFSHVNFVLQEQEYKPRYLPDKDEFLRYRDSYYREPNKPYEDLREFILKNKITEKEGVTIDLDIVFFHNSVQNGASVEQYLNYFTECGYYIDEIDDFETFVQLILNAHNNTRLYEHNGFTSNELAEQIGLKFPKDKFTSKVEHDDLCPCESGKIYKKCCLKKGILYGNFGSK